MGVSSRNLNPNFELRPCEKGDGVGMARCHLKGFTKSRNPGSAELYGKCYPDDQGQSSKWWAETMELRMEEPQAIFYKVINKADANRLVGFMQWNTPRHPTNSKLAEGFPVTKTDEKALIALLNAASNEVRIKKMLHKHACECRSKQCAVNQRSWLPNPFESCNLRSLRYVAAPNTCAIIFLGVEESLFAHTLSQG